MRLCSSSAYLTSAKRANFANELADRLRAIPGVERGRRHAAATRGRRAVLGRRMAASAARRRLSGQQGRLQGRAAGAFRGHGNQAAVGPHLRASGQSEEALDVAIIDRKLAKRVFGEEDPRGRPARRPLPDVLARAPRTDRGVVDNVRSASLAAEGRETVYVPTSSTRSCPLTYVVRTATDPASLIARIRAEAAAMDPDVPIAELSTLASAVSNAMSHAFLLALIGASPSWRWAWRRSASTA